MLPAAIQNDNGFWLIFDPGERNGPSDIQKFTSYLRYLRILDGLMLLFSL